MKRACIAIVEATRARLYTYQAADHARRANDEELQVALDLVHPDAPPAWFARDLLAALDRFVREEGYDHVIVVASPAMLDELRDADAPLRRAGVVLEEVPRDLAKLTSPPRHVLDLVPARPAGRRVRPPAPRLR